VGCIHFRCNFSPFLSRYGSLVVTILTTATFRCNKNQEKSAC